MRSCVCSQLSAVSCPHLHYASCTLLGPPMVPSVRPPQVLEGASALAVALGVCFVGSELAGALGFPGATISAVTGLTVAMATAVPGLLQGLVPSAEGLACIILQVLTALGVLGGGFTMADDCARVSSCMPSHEATDHLGACVGRCSLRLWVPTGAWRL